MLETLQQNLLFVVISALIAALIAFGAKYAERYLHTLHKVTPARLI